MEDDLRRVAGVFDNIFDFIGGNRYFGAILMVLYLFISMPFFIILTFVPLLSYVSFIEGEERYVFFAMMLVWLYIFFDVARDFYYSRHPAEYERAKKKREAAEAAQIERMHAEYGLVIERRVRGKPFFGISASLSRIPLRDRRLASFLAGALVILALSIILVCAGFSVIPFWVLERSRSFALMYGGLTVLGYAVCGGWGALYASSEREGSNLALFSQALFGSIPVGLVFPVLSLVTSWGSLSGVALVANTAVSGILFVSVGWFFFFCGGLLGRHMT